MFDRLNRVLIVIAGFGLCAGAYAGDSKKAKPPAAKPPVAKPSPPKPAMGLPPMGLTPVPRPFGTNTDRGFGGTHVGRPMASMGTNRPLAPMGTGRPLAPIGTDRPLASIGGGGPGASIQPPVSVPGGPGDPGGPIIGGGGRTIVVVPEIPTSDPGLEVAEPLPQAPIEAPALEQTDASTLPEQSAPTIDPIVAEMAQRLRTDGHAQFLRGEFHLAESTLRSAVDLLPDAIESNDARFELAFALLALGRVNSAAKEFVIVEARDPERFYGMLDAASAVGTKTFDRCVIEAGRYLLAYPIDSDALYVDALMQWWSGRAREAGLDLDRLAAIDPKYAGLQSAFVPKARDEALKPQ